MHVLCNICTNDFIPKTYIYDTLTAYEKKK